MVLRPLTIVAAALAAFHVWIFFDQLWTGAIADPGLVLRWLGAAALVGGLLFLRRQGESLLRSRKAVAIWVLAALLHGPALANRFEAPGAPAIPEVILTLSQTLMVVGLTGVGLLLAARSRRRHALVPVAILGDQAILPGYGLDGRLLLAPRPPPVTL